MTPDEIQMILGDFDKAEDGNDYLNIIENYEMRLREVLTQALEIAKGDMVLVPRESTNEMAVAYIEKVYELITCTSARQAHNQAYKAMIKAYEEGK